MVEGRGTTDPALVTVLLSVMTLSGVLAIISNGLVILAHFKCRRGMFERSIVSLAWVDVLTGLLMTPIVFCIYYYQCKGPLYFEGISKEGRDTNITHNICF